MNAALQLLFAYLLGSVLGGLLVGRLRGGVDLRSVGSGNPGSTNALRTQGKAFALAVVLVDAGKGLVAVTLLPDFAPDNFAPVSSSWQSFAPAGCGIAVLLGHLAPVWHGFRGGKGVATVGGSLLGLNPLLLLCALSTWLVVLFAKRIVSVASIATAASLPVFALLLLLLALAPAGEPLLWYAVVACTLVLFAHRDNIARLRAGSEPRLTGRS